MEDLIKVLLDKEDNSKYVLLTFPNIIFCILLAIMFEDDDTNYYLLYDYDLSSKIVEMAYDTNYESIKDEKLREIIIKGLLIILQEIGKEINS